ncbi:recombination regulator RecX [Fictibacillus gelatini]|uniref:recombination regulator RecX n=1 Tax=Fictibacillus gelatini TaxID=225985 RepID=UPI00041ABEC5|nr:recombination regulator RecX [Fictibacillus gelatini]
MAVITKITTQKKNKDRFNIYIDKGSGEEFWASVDADVLIAFQLKKGRQLPEDEQAAILSEDHKKQAFNKALNYLSYRMRAVKEIKDYLKKNEYPSEVIDSVIDKLSSYGYVDDTEFAKMFVRSRKNTTTKGPLVIRQELHAKGVSSGDIQKGLNEYPLQEQIEAAKKFAEKKAMHKNRASQKEQKQKIATQLMQKGFSKEVIEEALREVSFSSSEEEERDALIHQARKAHRKYKKYAGFDYERRMKQYLYAKGFSFSLIEEIMHSEDLEQ